MNKGKKIVYTFDNVKCVNYLCKRCGVNIWEKNWFGDTHKNCDKWFKNKAIRERAEKSALSSL